MTKQKSDLSRAFSEDGAIKTHVGGQALIEGVMMRGKYNWAVAVREPDGAIYVEEHDLNSGKDKNGWMYWPLVRGCRALVESLMLGFKALEIAALHAFGDEEGEQKAAAEATFVEAEAELEGAAAVAAEEEKRGERAAARDGFDWKRDFGNPDEMVDGLGAQRTLEVVSEADAPARRQAGDGSSTDEEFGHREMVVSMVVGLVLGVVLFIVAPAAITNLIVVVTPVVLY